MMRTHDYCTRRGWGHDIVIAQVIDKGMKLRCSGWGTGIRKGDFLILPNGSESTRYQVAEIEYKPDPPDMWSADLTFAPRPQGAGA